MEGIVWLGLAKKFVLIWFFCIFLAAVLWTLLRGRELEDYRNLPLEDSDE